MQSRHLVKTARNSLKTHYFALAGQLATFFFHLYIIFNIFFLHLIKKKSGQVARKPQTLGRKGFSLATFEIKVGKKWARPVFPQFSRPYTGYPTSKFSAKSEPKVGKWPVLQTKSGQQNDLLLTVIVAAFDHLGRDFQAVYGRILF